jgi:3-methylfumaryl-CoA hydratase
MNGLASETNLDDLRGWVGRELWVQDPLTPFPARALAAALGREERPAHGDPLPPARHWLFFLETPQLSDTGVDGHPKRGGFLPPVPLGRRMWAGGRLDVSAPLVLGKPATRRTIIRSVEAKSGRTGPLVFVTLDHELSQDERLCVREEQNLVYRPMPTAAVPLPPGEVAPGNAELSRVFHPDSLLLFRYSALTYNGHRIHYDRPYAVAHEFYPALVVQGPLIATLLLDLLRDQLPERRLQTFQFRALRPSFEGAPLTVNSRRDGNRVHLWSSDAEGRLGMSAIAELA